MPFENKKQVLIICGAVVAGVVAVFLTSNYIKNSIEGQTASLAEKYDIKQKQMVSQIQQRSDQQMAALAQELERVKTEQADNLKKQMIALAQAQAARQPIVPQKVRKASIALKTPAGKRAITVKIDSLAAVG